MPSAIPRNIVGIDFETYFDTKYSLRSKEYTTTTYIRDPQFKVQCVGIRTHKQRKARWWKGKDVEKALNNIDWTECALLAHHAHFDGLIAQHHFGIVPAFYMCTLSMARPLHGGEIRNDLEHLSRYYGGRGKILDYLSPTKGVRDLPTDLMRNLGLGCARDVDEMWRIFNKMRPHIPDSEMHIIHETVAMYANPVLHINKELAQQELDNELARRAKAVKSVRRHIRTQFPDLDVKNDEVVKAALRSRDKFADLLRGVECEPPTKISKRTGLPTYAFAQTDLDFQALARHKKKAVRVLVEAKGVVSSTIAESKPARMLQHADPAFPVYLAYGKAHTLRWAGGDSVNPQNFPRQGNLRNALIAPPGHTLVIADSSQIEDRTNCWFSGQHDVLQQYRDFDIKIGPDVYRLMAARVYAHTALKDITSAQRFVGKVCRLMLGYGAGLPRFGYTLEAGTMGPPIKLPADELQRAHSAYRAGNYAIRNMWYTANDFLYIMAFGSEEPQWVGPLGFAKERIYLPNGLFLRYPNLRGSLNPRTECWGDWTYNENTYIYGGALVENFIQALARIIVADQLMAALSKMTKESRVVLLVHDEGVFSVKVSYAERAKQILAKELRIPPTWAPDLPVNCEVKVSPFYIKD